MAEIYTTMENRVDFVIERLYRGSVMNHRSFLLLDKIDVTARCATPVSLYYISLSKILELRQRCPILNENIKNIEDELVDKENAVALDYIITKKTKHAGLERDEHSELYRNHLTVQLKNAVMHHIVKYREFRRVPKLRDILMMAIEKKKKEMQAARKKQQSLLLDARPND